MGAGVGAFGGMMGRGGLGGINPMAGIMDAYEQAERSFKFKFTANL